MGADCAVSSQEENFLEAVCAGLGGKPDVIIDATGGDVVKEMTELAHAKTRIIAYGVPPFDWAEKKTELEKDRNFTSGISGVESAKIIPERMYRMAGERRYGRPPGYQSPHSS